MARHPGACTGRRWVPAAVPEDVASLPAGREGDAVCERQCLPLQGYRDQSHLLRKQCYNSSRMEVPHLPFQADSRPSSLRSQVVLRHGTIFNSRNQPAPPPIKTSSLDFNANLNQSIVSLRPSEPVNHLSKSSSTTVAPAHPQSRKHP